MSITQLTARLDRDSGGFQLVVVEPCVPIRECGGNRLSSPLEPQTEEILSRIAGRVWGLYAQATVCDTHTEGRDLEIAANKVCEKQRQVKEGALKIIKVIFEGAVKYQP